MSIHVGYEPATRDSGGPSPGAEALRDWYLDRYSEEESPAPADLGIYNPKRLPSGDWSLHAEGRADDLGTAPYSPPPWGWELANLLKDYSAELGIQCLIFDRKIWSGAYPYDGWREYGGSNPHTGHIHGELSTDAAQNLTVEKIQQVLSSDKSDGDSNDKPKTDWREEIVKGMETVDLRGVTGSSSTWVRGDAARRLQGLLLSSGYGPDGLVGRNDLPDGIAGPATRHILGHAQEKYGTGHSSNPSTPDYIAGAKTWSALLGV